MGKSDGSESPNSCTPRGWRKRPAFRLTGKLASDFAQWAPYRQAIRLPSQPTRRSQSSGPSPALPGRSREAQAGPDQPHRLSPRPTPERPGKSKSPGPRSGATNRGRNKDQQERRSRADREGDGRRKRCLYGARRADFQGAEFVRSMGAQRPSLPTTGRRPRRQGSDATQGHRCAVRPSGRDRYPRSCQVRNRSRHGLWPSMLTRSLRVVRRRLLPKGA